MSDQQNGSVDRRMLDVLEEILLWTRVGMYPAVERMMQSQFGNARPEERLAYELLGGDYNYRDIVNIAKKAVPDAKISPATISTWATKWEKFGLVQKNGKAVTRLFSLLDFGLEVPRVPE
jgi:hypothetical protein